MVSRHVAARPQAVYDFLTGAGVAFIQFNPVVERLDDDGRVAQPPPAWPGLTRVSPDTPEPGAYGAFLIKIFDHWVRHDVGRVHVMNFEWALAAWCQMPATVCLFARRCGRAVIVEQDGSLYACDHYVYPGYRLGCILEDDPAILVESPAQRGFADAKEAGLAETCQYCSYLFACRGECPKNRFIPTTQGKPDLNYLCPDYRKYFLHITPAMNAMARFRAPGP